MPRPIKVGLDYFPLDTDVDEDLKVKYVEAEHGDRSFGIYVKLLCWIYKHNGYFADWDRRSLLLFSKEKGIETDFLRRVVESCIGEGLFDKKIFQKYRVLTGNSIQRRYIKICSFCRRKEINLERRLVCVDNNDINACINPDNYCINWVNGGVNIIKKSKGK